jgi:hypothetical protein
MIPINDKSSTFDFLCQLLSLLQPTSKEKLSSFQNSDFFKHAVSEIDRLSHQDRRLNRSVKILKSLIDSPEEFELDTTRADGKTNNSFSKEQTSISTLKNSIFKDTDLHPSIPSPGKNQNESLVRELFIFQVVKELIGQLDEFNRTSSDQPSAIREGASFPKDGQRSQSKVSDGDSEKIDFVEKPFSCIEMKHLPQEVQPMRRMTSQTTVFEDPQGKQDFQIGSSNPKHLNVESIRSAQPSNTSDVKPLPRDAESDLLPIPKDLSNRGDSSFQSPIERKSDPQRISKDLSNGEASLFAILARSDSRDAAPLPSSQDVRFHSHGCKEPVMTPPGEIKVIPISMPFTYVASVNGSGSRKMKKKKKETEEKEEDRETALFKDDFESL